MKAKTRYIVLSFAVIAGYAVLAAIVSMKISSAVQLAPITKIVVLALLWIVILCFVGVFIRYYKNLDDSNLE